MVGCYAESMLVRYNVVKVCNREYAHHGIALLCIAEYACICSACTLYDVQVVRYKAVMQSKRVREYARHGRGASVWEKLA